jgi:hypothetical protein
LFSWPNDAGAIGGSASVEKRCDDADTIELRRDVERSACAAALPRHHRIDVSTSRNEAEDTALAERSTRGSRYGSK